MKKSITNKVFMTMFTLIVTIFTVGVVNAEGTTNLTVNNIQTDNASGTYTYKITVEDVSGAIKYSIDGKEGYAVFDAKGNASLTVNSNSTITLYDLPLNKNYTVEQTSAKSGYKTLVNNVETTITKGVTSPTNSVSFTNQSTDEKTTVDTKNPVTADPVIIALAVLLVAGAGFIALKKLKVRRYQ